MSPSNHRKTAEFVRSMAGFAIILLFIFSSPGITASTFSPTPEEAALLTKNPSGPKLDLSALTPYTEAGRTFFKIDDMRYPAEAVGINNAFTGNRWPGGVLYYQFDSAVTTTHRAAWRSAAAAWSAVAPVHFTESTGSGNYVRVQNSTGNNSYVGMTGGSQVMNIHDWGYRYVIAHEIGHALGSIHEHSRANRDAYINVLYANIQSGMQENFDVEPGSISYGAYDFDSVMHYPRNAFSRNGQNTIEPKPPYWNYLYTMGQSTHLSTQDISGMVQRYTGSGGSSPPNNDFANRLALTGSSGFLAGNSFGATSEAGEPNHVGFSPSASVWYSWSVPTSGSITFDTLRSDFDTLLAVYIGSSLTTLNPVASNDDISPGVVRQSRVTFFAMAGQTYQIAVDGYNGASGNIVLNWSGGSVSKLDFDGNGVTDILFQNNSTGQRAAWLMDGIAYSGSTNLPSAATEWSIVGTGDFNSDGKSDIVLQDYSTRTIAVWYMDGTSRTSGAYFPNVPEANWNVATSGDFNRDGKPDLVLENQASGQRQVWLLNGLNRSSVIEFPVSAAWKIVGTGDFDGDGKTDIVFQGYSSQQAMVWLMDGTTHVSSANLPTPTAQWRIAGTGDFNRDGKTDLILQNISTGQRAVWLMNGVTVTSGVYLPSASLPWDIRNR